MIKILGREVKREKVFDIISEAMSSHIIEKQDRVSLNHFIFSDSVLNWSDQELEDFISEVCLNYLPKNRLKELFVSK